MPHSAHAAQYLLLRMSVAMRVCCCACALKPTFCPRRALQEKVWCAFIPPSSFFLTKTQPHYLMFQMDVGVPPMTSAFRLEVRVCLSMECLQGWDQQKQPPLSLFSAAIS
ncbi:uncharacterized protein LOC118143009 isoform X2 [Callithrix jacchus]